MSLCVPRGSPPRTQVRLASRAASGPGREPALGDPLAEGGDLRTSRERTSVARGFAPPLPALLARPVCEIMTRSMRNQLVTNYRKARIGQLTESRAECVNESRVDAGTREPGKERVMNTCPLGRARDEFKCGGLRQREERTHLGHFMVRGNGDADIRCACRCSELRRGGAIHRPHMKNHAVRKSGGESQPLKGECPARRCEAPVPAPFHGRGKGAGKVIGANHERFSTHRDSIEWWCRMLSTGTGSDVRRSGTTSGALLNHPQERDGPALSADAARPVEAPRPRRSLGEVVGAQFGLQIVNDDHRPATFASPGGS